MEENVRIWLLVVTFYCVSSLSLGWSRVVRQTSTNLMECSFDQEFSDSGKV